MFEVLCTHAWCIQGLLWMSAGLAIGKQAMKTMFHISDSMNAEDGCKMELSLEEVIVYN